VIRSAAFIVAMAATVVPAIAASQTSDGSHGSAPRLIACAQAALGGRKVLRNVRGIRNLLKNPA
jgi:hypothetical protein